MKLNTMKKLNLVLLAVASTLSSMTFGKTFVLDTNNNQEPLYRTELPIAVYQHTRSNTLADITITNAAGEQVPYDLLAFEQTYAPAKLKVNKKVLAVYPITEASLNNPSALQIQLDKNEGKTSLNITSNDQTAANRPLFLLDAGKENPMFDTLELNWQGAEGKLMTVEVLRSVDLNNWVLAGQGALLKANNGDSQITQNSIKLDKNDLGRYLQIRPLEKSDAFTVVGAAAVISQKEAALPASQTQLAKFIKRELGSKAGQTNLTYEALGHYPASELRVQLPSIGIITAVTIATRNTLDEPWVTLTSASVYDILKNEKRMQSPNIKIDPKVARYWQLQFNEASGGIGEVNPSLALNWSPQTLVWNARGQAPFTLHVGENPEVVNNMNIASLIPDYKVEKIQALPIARVNWNVANEVTPTSAAATNSWETPLDYKRWYLWGGLLIGVLLLAGMAYSLLKNTPKK